MSSIERQALARFQRASVDSAIPDARRHRGPVTASEPYPVQAGEDIARKAQALVAWVTIPTADSFRLLAMKVLSEVLLGNAGSPLRKALIDSKLGTAMADGSGLADDYRESVFGAGLKDVAAADAEKVQQVVIETLERLVDEGVDQSQVDAAIHHLEFEKRERSNAGFPYALRLLFTAVPAYHYGGDPYAALNFDADLERLQKARAEGRFFENLIRAELLDNPHRGLLTIVPDPGLEERTTSHRARPPGRHRGRHGRVREAAHRRGGSTPEGGAGRQAGPVGAPHARAERYPHALRGHPQPHRGR